MKNSIKQLVFWGLMLCAGFFVFGSGAYADVNYTNDPPVCQEDICTFTSYLGGSVTYYSTQTGPPMNVVPRPRVGPFPKAGQVRLYFVPLHPDLSSGLSPVIITLKRDSQSISFAASPGCPCVFDTGIFVNQGDYITISAVDHFGICVGWNVPDSANKCGSGLPLPPTGGVQNPGPFRKVDITSYVSIAEQAGEPLVSKQCWADWPEWDGDYDFEDYFMVFSYVPLPPVPTVDIKANGLDGPITIGGDQSAYQIQIDNNSNFSSPEVDSGKVISSSNSYATLPGKLSWNTTYYWRLKVWDSKDLFSSWIPGPSFITPAHAYPSIDFSWNPQRPAPNVNVQFTDESTVYGGATKQSWLWTFQDGSPANSIVQDATTTFASTSSKTVSLRVRDSSNFECTGSKSVNIRPSLPEYKEVPPIIWLKNFFAGIVNFFNGFLKPANG